MKYDLEAINIMILGGEQLCEHAKERCIANIYQMDDETRRENILRWNNIKNRIRPLANILKVLAK